MSEKPVVHYYSDVLCVWAYVGNIRLERLVEKYASEVAFDLRYCSVFPDAVTKLEKAWSKRGGFEAVSAQMQKVASRFDHAPVHPDVWTKVRPVSSTPVHIFLKAAELAEDEGIRHAPLLERPSYKLSWALREAFFREARDIATRAVQMECAEAVGLDRRAIETHLESGLAAALLDRDLNAAAGEGVKGSPTFSMNGGRQILYGNVGFRLLDANVQELLRRPAPGDASWC